MLDRLRSVLGKVGKRTEVIELSDGTRVLVLVHGARVLGLFAPGSGENFFWTHPALGGTATARALFDGDAWQNTGGDRTWLAPEIDVFFPDFPNRDRYVQPRALDPGEWSFIDLDGDEGPFLSNLLSVDLSRSGRKVDLELRKSVGPASDPVRHEPDLRGLGRVEYAGYSLRTRLELTEPETAPPAVGLWGLLQMPHGGDLLVPTHSRTDPRICFGRADPGDLAATDHLVRWRMRSKGEHKIAIRAIAVTGRAGYLYSSGGGLALVVRNFPVNPSGEYVDVPWDDPADFGYAVQACNISSGLGDFSELEHHAPAIGGKGGSPSCVDVSQVWAFRGGEEAIRAIARKLLGPEA